jgi:hypothetical protein
MPEMKALDDKVDCLKFNVQTILFLSAINMFMNVTTIVVAFIIVWPG